MSKGISPAPIPRDRSKAVRKWLDSCCKWMVRRELGHRRECRNCGGKEAREGRGDTEEVLAAAFDVGAADAVVVVVGGGGGGGGRDNVVVVATVAVVDDIAVLVAIAVVLVVVAVAGAVVVVVVVVVAAVVPVNVVVLRFPSLQPVLLSSPMLFLFSVRGVQGDDIFPVIGVAVRSVWLVTVASSPFPHY